MIVQLSVSSGGIPKLAIASATLMESGLTGDGWRYPFHGGRRQAILLITAEGIEELISQGFSLFPGALGENLTTRGLDRRDLRLGQRFQIGAAAIELTRRRTPCATIGVYGSGIESAIYDPRVQACDHGSPRWGLSGFYASVIRQGLVRTGDLVTRLE